MTSTATAPELGADLPGAARPRRRIPIWLAVVASSLYFPRGYAWVKRTS